MRVIFLLTILMSSLFSYQNRIRILETLYLNDITFKGFSFSEISGATYDSESKTLYMVSDKGILFKFKASFDNKVHLKKISAHYLRDRKGKKLSLWRSDSEGITIDNRGRLFVSFEGKPTIAQISKSGVILKRLKLPKSIRKARYRNRNKTLESLTFHPKYGLLTAFEYSVRPNRKINQAIYSLSGRVWKVKLEPFKNSAITDIEYLQGDDILILERAYSGIFSNFAITLKRFNLKSKKSEVIYSLQSTNGDSVENFEALAKVGNSRFIMISDDNDNFFSNTKLIYFEVIK